LPPLRFLVEANPIELRHPEIAEDEAVGSVLDLFESNPTIGGSVDLILVSGQRVGQQLSYEGLVSTTRI
jgi:hypothetical protein